MLRKQRIAQILQRWTWQDPSVAGFSAQKIADYLNMRRNTVSYELNRLVEENQAEKISGKPVLFRFIGDSLPSDAFSTDSAFFEAKLSGASSIISQIELAKAAVLYPPKGLYTLIIGKTGVGKTYFAKLMYEFARHKGMIKENAPFVMLNCADYAENQQLLVSQLFGYAKGSFTGAIQDKAGLVAKAEGGYLFLDEVHNLSAEGQEILFSLMDSGYYRRFGESETSQKSDVRIICATTDEQKAYLLQTFLRRIPITIELPSLEKRNLKDRYELIKQFVQEEASRVGQPIFINRNLFNRLLFTEFSGNIGELKELIKLLCAKAFVDSLEKNQQQLTLSEAYLDRVACGIFNQGILEIYQGLENPYVNVDLLVTTKASSPQLNAQNDSGFYGRLQSQMSAYNEAGYPITKVEALINQEIENYFARLLHESQKGLKLKIDLSKLVPEQLLIETESLINQAEKNLGKKFNQNVWLGLALHTKAFIERKNEKQSLYHPTITKIRDQHPEEFQLASCYLRKVCKFYHLPFSEAEAVLIAMFLLTKNAEVIPKQYQIILLCHGNQTATSIAQTANQLLDNHWIDGIDMPLDISLAAIKEKLFELIDQTKPSKGILLLMDMGSLEQLPIEIWEKYHKRLAVGMISGFNLLMLLEVSRKLLFFEEPLADIIQNSNFQTAITTDFYKGELPTGPKIIWTVCMSGLGTSRKLQSLLKQCFMELHQPEILVEALDYFSFIEFQGKLPEQVMAVVGTLSEETLLDIPFISLDQFLSGKGFFQILDYLGLACSKTEAAAIRQVIAKELSFETILQKIQTIEPKHLLKIVVTALEKIQEPISNFSQSLWLKLIIHTAFMIERLMVSKDYLSYPNLEDYYLKQQRLFKDIRTAFKPIASFYNIDIPNTEIAYLIDILLEK